MRKIAVAIGAVIALAAVAPASAQGIWIGVPGFGVGIGAAPTYGYPYYDGYAPTYVDQGYAYQPGYEYDSYGYVRDGVSTVYSYEPAVTYGPTQTYRYTAPRARYAHNYNTSSAEVRTTRSFSDGRRVINRDRDRRAAAVHNTEVRNRAVTRNHSAVGTEKEGSTSRRVRSEEASKAMARGQDSRHSKGLENKKARTSRTSY
jgi:hypothetical protein